LEALKSLLRFLSIVGYSFRLLEFVKLFPGPFLIAHTKSHQKFSSRS